MKIKGQTVYSHETRIRRLSLLDHDTGCWNWISTTRNDYGRLIIGSRADGTRKSISAHRLSYLTFHGDIPEGLHIYHKCDNKKCVNPEHLFAGTRQENVDDREAKGRNNHVYGEKSGRAKLSDADVISARRLRSIGVTFQEIASRFMVSKKTIMSAINGTTWAHVLLPKPPAMQPKEQA